MSEQSQRGILWDALVKIPGGETRKPRVRRQTREEARAKVNRAYPGCSIIEIGPVLRRDNMEFGNPESLAAARAASSHARHQAALKGMAAMLEVITEAGEEGVDVKTLEKQFGITNSAIRTRLHRLRKEGKIYTDKRRGTGALIAKRVTE